MPKVISKPDALKNPDATSEFVKKWNLDFGFDFGSHYIAFEVKTVLYLFTFVEISVRRSLG